MPKQVEEAEEKESPIKVFRRTLREKSGLTNQAVDAMLKAFGESLQEAAEHGKVQIRGVGTFEKKITAARIGRNPATGEAVNVPEKAKVTLKTTMHY